MTKLLALRKLLMIVPGSLSYLHAYLTPSLLSLSLSSSPSLFSSLPLYLSLSLFLPRPPPPPLSLSLPLSLSCSPSLSLFLSIPLIPSSLPLSLLSLTGCLLQYLRQHKELVEKTEIILDMAVQICSAMRYLETNGFIHRDLVSSQDC